LSCSERGWRSKRAKQRTDAGSGIGLWLIDNIMRAMGGQLSVKCEEISIQSGKTLVSLVF
jgi:signal transduction histidine kinase